MLGINRIGITLDIDWAPDEVVKFVIDTLFEYQVKATLFATHKSELIKSLDISRYEIGIHPDFSRDGNYNNVIQALQAVYPQAIGVRSHGLFESSMILRAFLDNGLKYDVNTFIPMREGLYPFLRLNKLVRIPFYWEDDAYFSQPATFELSDLQAHKNGLKIYNFHPIHIYMNTSSPEHYREYKAFYHQPDMLSRYRNEGKGVRTLFIDLLRYLSENNMPTCTCREIYEEYLKTQER